MRVRLVTAAVVGIGCLAACGTEGVAPRGDEYVLTLCLSRADRAVGGRVVAAIERHLADAGASGEGGVRSWTSLEAGVRAWMDRGATRAEVEVVMSQMLDAAGPATAARSIEQQPAGGPQSFQESDCDVEQAG